MPGGVGAIRAGSAFVEIFADKTRLEATLKSARQSVQLFSARALQAGAALSGFGAGLGLPLLAAVKSAGDAQETLSRFEAVFGTQTKAADEFAEALAKSTGRSSLEIKDGLASFQAFFKGLGFGEGEARKMSEQMAQLAIDFGSFNNLTDEESIGRFLSGLSGSSEVFDKYGINLKAAALAQKGVSSSSSEMEKVLARTQIIMEAMTTQGAVGDAVRTAGSFANQTKRLTATLKDLSISVGNALLPVVTPLVGVFNSVAMTIKELAIANPELIVTLAALATTAGVAGAGLITLGIAGSTIAAGLGVLAAVAGTVSAPILAIGAAITAVVAAVSTGFAIMLAKGVRFAIDFNGVFDAIKDYATGVINGILDLFGTIGDKVRELLGLIPKATEDKGPAPGTFTDGALPEGKVTTIVEPAATVTKSSTALDLGPIGKIHFKARSNGKPVSVAQAIAEKEAESTKGFTFTDRMARQLVAAGNAESVGTFSGAIAGQIAGIGPLRSVEEKLDELIDEVKKAGDKPDALEFGP